MHARSQVPGKGETGSCGGLCVCREVGFVAWEGGDWLRIAESVGGGSEIYMLLPFAVALTAAPPLRTNLRAYGLRIPCCTDPIPEPGRMSKCMRRARRKGCMPVHQKFCPVGCGTRRRTTTYFPTPLTHSRCAPFRRLLQDLRVASAAQFIPAIVFQQQRRVDSLCCCECDVARRQHRLHTEEAAS